MPLSLKEILWEDHEAVILNEIINELGLDFLKLQYARRKMKTSVQHSNVAESFILWDSSKELKENLSVYLIYSI